MTRAYFSLPVFFAAGHPMPISPGVQMDQEIERCDLLPPTIERAFAIFEFKFFQTERDVALGRPPRPQSICPFSVAPLQLTSRHSSDFGLLSTVEPLPPLCSLSPFSKKEFPALHLATITPLGSMS